MKRIISLAICLIMIAAIIPTETFADDPLPNGYWPALAAYNNAVKAGNEADILSTGDALEKVCTSIKLNNTMANQLYMIYYKRLQLSIYENKHEYTNAINNTSKLLDMSRYLTANGVDRNDMIIYCQAHLKAVTPTYGVYAASYAQPASALSAQGSLYGAVNESSMLGDKGITSFYVNIESESVRKFAGIISNFDNGSRAILINYNFLKEGDGARAIVKGTYDTNVVDSFKYLATLKSPVLVRIGGEMNVWTTAATPAEFKKAYNYIAAVARKQAPNAKLVWSPNFVSTWNVNAEDFYPDEKYVDWVGISLYYTYKPRTNQASWIEYAHNLGFADPIICAEEIVKIADKHNKPVVVTESGTVRTAENDGTGEAWAAAKAAKEFSTLNMVFPQIKAIVYFDRVQNGKDYTLTGEVGTQVSAAIKNNPALSDSTVAAAATWIPISRFSEKAPETLILGAAGHTYASAELSATYKLDGKQIASSKKAPNYCKIKTSTLTEGNHELIVNLFDGAGYSVKIKYVLTVKKGNISILPAGDVNSDGKLNNRDVIALMKAVAASRKLDMLIADVNGDGKLNSRDVIALMKFVVAQAG